MIRFGAAAGMAFAVVLYGSAASAGVYSDDLGKCLVKTTSANDKTVLVQWIFVTMSLNPTVKPLANVTTDQRDALNRQAGALVQRLLVVDCRKEAIDALKYEGTNVFESSFQLLGQVATMGLMSDPSVGEGMEKFAATIDKDKFIELGKEAGVYKEPAPEKKTNK